MLLNNADAKQFPIFKTYLESDFGQLASNTKIIDGVTKWGGFGDAADAKRFIMFGSKPIITISSSKGVEFSQFNQFPSSISVVVNIVDAFQVKDDLNRKKDLNALVFLTTGNGHRIFQIGLKLLELIIQGNLLISKDTTVVPDLTHPLIIKQPRIGARAPYSG